MFETIEANNQSAEIVLQPDDRAEGRKAVRFPLSSTVRIITRSSAAGTWMTACGLNLSATGIAFLASEPLSIDALVQIELPNSRMTAMARVRNCQPRTGGWRIGAELAQPFLSMS